MIAHEQHAQSLAVEKHLNCLGYYRIAPVSSFDEVLILTRSPAEAFDLLIISRELYANEESSAFFATEVATNIDSVLIYDDHRFITPEELLLDKSDPN
jgi:hypothetical protein